MTARPDTTSSLEDRVAALERIVMQLVGAADQLVQVEEDGPPRPPGRWLRMKAAARATGYSVSGLKKMCERGSITFDYEGPHRLINVATVPRKVSKVSKVPA
jgi:hypothetical protein